MPEQILAAIPLLSCLGRHCSEAGLLTALERHGVVLVRHRDQSLDDLMALSERHGRDFIRLPPGAGPRQPVGGNLGRLPVAGHESLFVATDPQFSAALPLHGELYFQYQTPPDLLWFYCPQPPVRGGETWLCNGQMLFDALPESIQQAFQEQLIVYTRHLDRQSWPRIFGCAEFDVVQAFLQDQGIEASLLPDGDLHTRFVTPALRQRLGHWVFINNLLPFALRERESPETVRAWVRFADGQPIPARMLETLKTVAQSLRFAHSWQKGDILLIDNRWILHGRDTLPPGPRELYLRMSHAALPSLPSAGTG